MNRELWTVINLSVVTCLMFLGSTIIGPILPQYALGFDISIALSGWAVSAFSLARVVTDLPAGLLADRAGKRPVMVGGLICVALSSVLAAFAGSYDVFLLARGMQGFGTALYGTSAMAWVARVAAGPSRGKVMSAYTGLVFLGISFGPAVGGLVAAAYGLSAPFWLYAALAGAGIFAMIPLKESSDPHTHSAKLVGRAATQIREMLSDRSFVLISIAVFAMFFLNAGFLSTLVPLYAALNLSLPEDQIGLILVLATIGTAITVLPSGWLSDRIGRKLPNMSCLFVSAATLVLVPLQGSFLSLAIVMLGYGLASGLRGSIGAWPADLSPPERLEMTMGIYRVFGDIGMVVGPVFVTYVANWLNPDAITSAPFLLSAILALFAGIALLGARDPTAKLARNRPIE